MQKHLGKINGQKIEACRNCVRLIDSNLVEGSCDELALLVCKHWWNIGGCLATWHACFASAKIDLKKDSKRWTPLDSAGLPLDSAGLCWSYRNIDISDWHKRLTRGILVTSEMLCQNGGDPRCLEICRVALGHINHCLELHTLQHTTLQDNAAGHEGNFLEMALNTSLNINEWSALGERMVWQAADWSAFQETVDSTLRSWACIVRKSRECDYNTNKPKKQKSYHDNCWQTVAGDQFFCQKTNPQHKQKWHPKGTS